MLYEKTLQDPDAYDFNVSGLGANTKISPLRGREFVADDERIAFSSQVKNILQQLQEALAFPSFEKAGPREKLFHDPKQSRAAIVTCGGLCPGLNNVIKGLVTVLIKGYGVDEVLGIRYGYRGLSKQSRHQPLTLNQEVVDRIHNQGGTILGSSRGGQDPAEMVDQLKEWGVNLLFCIGGDGTLKGAQQIGDEVIKRNLPISVIGIPKTIDNDLLFVEKTFGYETSVQTASEIISSAHHEAEGAENGVGIVKLMGRDSGFITAGATLANSVVDFCLIPEIEFELEGERGLLQALNTRLGQKQNVVIVVAEGAGQNLFAKASKNTDQSGNTLKEDIGSYLKEEISRDFANRGQEGGVRYIDPSYHIRSVPANASDAIFCYQLAENAVHAALAGKTNLLIGHWNNFFTHVPISLATRERRKVDVDGALWNGVLGTTQQNDLLG